jgi:IclR family acetate operon transcriptional repressor
MQELHKLTSETVNLLVMDGIEVLYLDKILAERPLRFSTQPGTRALAALTGAGKAMLAHESAARVAEVVEQTIATGDERADGLELSQFLDELKEIRSSGYAKSDGSWTMGILSYAAPILGHDGRAAASMSVTAPRERITPEKEASIIEALLYICARIAETVGRL